MSKRCTHDRPPAQGLGTVHQGLGDLGVRACRDPPTAVPASAPTKSRPRAQSVHSGLHVRRRVHSEAFPGLPRRIGSDGTTTPPSYSKDGPLLRPRRHRNRPQGSDVPPLLARRRIVIHVLPLSPFNYKRRGLGPPRDDAPDNTHTRTPSSRLRATSQTAPRPLPRPGTSSLSPLACNPLLRALRYKEYKFDPSDWT